MICIYTDLLFLQFAFREIPSLVYEGKKIKFISELLPEILHIENFCICQLIEVDSKARKEKHFKNTIFKS